MSFNAWIDEENVGNGIQKVLDFCPCIMYHNSKSDQLNTDNHSCRKTRMVASVYDLQVAASAFPNISCANSLLIHRP